MHINPFIESKVALENDCKNKKITIVLVYMSFFSGETPCSATGAGTGAKRGRTPAETGFWGDIQFLGMRR